MKRPKVELENYKQVYAYYQDYGPPRLASRLAWRAFNGIYQPRITFVDGARETFSWAQAEGIPQIIAFNHLTDVHDQFVAGATLQQIMPDGAGRTRILTKDLLLRQVPRGLGLVGDALCGIPVFRKKDHGVQSGIVDSSTEALYNCSVAILESGQNLVGFPEGTHNKNNPRFLGKVRPGMAEIACRAVRQCVPVTVTAIGMSYGQPGEKQHARHATVIVGETFDVIESDTVEKITEDIREGLQNAVAVAFELHAR
ncbi:MAG TPA: 1-acyl-sn-glycerol-3-phosphate acyltransferase [Candidatus Bathyarchaeia archaeon]|nr:1-acyl-sn-glycerol-3-phosphate acyltransferase [Candidatus Bathyarchaeia archaeon]